MNEPFNQPENPAGKPDNAFQHAPLPNWQERPNQPYPPYGGSHFQQPPTNGLAIASMVLGIVGVVFAFCFWPLALVLGLIGLPLGSVGLSQVNNGEYSGRGMAITGIVLSIISLAIPVLAIAFLASL